MWLVWLMLEGWVRFVFFCLLGEIDDFGVVWSVGWGIEFCFV